MSHENWKKKMAERREKIRARRAAGATVDELAKRHGVTRQRIHAICKAKQ